MPLSHACAPAWRAPSRLALALTLALAASLPLAARAAGLGFDETLALARESAPSLRAASAALAGASAARPAATTLPDPRLSLGVENLPVSGPDRFRTARDSATMQRLTLMQEVPNRAKRQARGQVAEARVERERAALALAGVAVRREAGLAWLGVHYAERRLALLADLRRENQLLQQTLPSRIAAGPAAPADLTMARQEALALDDRADEATRDVARARAELRRWVGERAGEPLQGGPVLARVAAERVRAGLDRYAELTAFGAMRAIAAAEVAEADAEQRGDWSWEIAYSRRPRYDDMVSLQLSVELPWQRERRQQPALEAKRREAERIDAEREDLRRRLAAEAEAMLAESAALDAQIERLQGAGVALATQRVDLATASYQAGRADLGPVLAARAQALELRLRAIDLEAQRSALHVRLSTLIAEE